MSRYPVCSPCLSGLQPLEADYFCESCHSPFATPYPLDHAGVCSVCRLGYRGFDRAHSYGFYDGPLRRLIHLMKYSGVYTLARPLAGRLALAMPRERRFDAIVPVPMHWLNRWRRGFNQAALLAGELGVRTGLPVYDCLARRGRSAPQAGLSDLERRRNVRRAYQVPKPESVKDRHLLLVDDVFTTGATASACSAALKQAGAQTVTVLTLARADRRPLVADLPRVSTGVKSSPSGRWQ